MLTEIDPRNVCADYYSACTLSQTFFQGHIEDGHAILNNHTEESASEVLPTGFWTVHLSDGNSVTVMAPGKGAAYKAAASLYPRGKAPMSAGIEVATVKTNLTF